MLQASGGMGKTTLLLELACQATEGELDSADGSSPIIIYAHLGELRNVSGHLQSRLSEYLYSCLGSTSRLLTSIDAEAFLLRVADKLLFLFDGIDQTGGNEVIESVLDSPDVLLSEARVLIAGREQGFNRYRERFDSVWDLWVIEHLTPEHCKEYFDRYEDVTNEKLIPIVRAIVRQDWKQRRNRPTFDTPLLLAMLVAIATDRTTIEALRLKPGGRLRLFQKFFEVGRKEFKQDRYLTRFLGQRFEILPDLVARLKRMEGSINPPIQRVWRDIAFKARQGKSFDQRWEVIDDLEAFRMAVEERENRNEYGIRLKGKLFDIATAHVLFHHYFEIIEEENKLLELAFTHQSFQEFLCCEKIVELFKQWFKETKGKLPKKPEDLLTAKIGDISDVEITVEMGQFLAHMLPAEHWVDQALWDWCIVH